MKKVLLSLIIALISVLNFYSQSPEKFNYQAVLRDASGNILANQNVSIDIEIKETSPTGNIVFSESHAVTTNAQGVANFTIGDTNDLSSVNFSSTNNYFVTTKLNGNEMGTMQMLSVPYALNSNGLTLKSPDGKVYQASVTPSGKVVFHLNDSETTAHQKMLERLQEILDNLNITEYTHTSESVIDEANGIYKYDCSGFICEIAMPNVLPNHYADLYTQYQNLHPADIRPRAWTFYDYFRDILGPDYDPDDASTCEAENQYWKVFTDINEVQKGDLLIARYHDDWRSWYYNQYGSNASTGHVMTVWGPPVRVSDDQNSTQYREYDMLILDASGSPHANDTRENNPACLDGSGIGYGWMRFKISTHASKRPYKYKWKPTSSTWYNLYDVNSNVTDYTRLGGIIFARYIGE